VDETGRRGTGTGGLVLATKWRSLETSRLYGPQLTKQLVQAKIKFPGPENRLCFASWRHIFKKLFTKPFHKAKKPEFLFLLRHAKILEFWKANTTHLFAKLHMLMLLRTKPINCWLPRDACRKLHS